MPQPTRSDSAFDLASFDLWAYGAAAAAFAVFAGWLVWHLPAIWRQAAPMPPSDTRPVRPALRQLPRPAWWFWLAQAAAMAWALAGAAAAWRCGQAALLCRDDWAGGVFDALRYAAWFACLAGLIHVHPREHAKGLWACSVVAVVLALGLSIWGLGAARWPSWPLAPLLWRAYAGLGLAVLGLIWSEQLIRRVPEGARWSLKPLALAVVLMAGYDLYLYTQAALMHVLDSTAHALRPAVHALTVPLLVLAFRRTDWRVALQVSRKAAFHSAALLIVGVYLVAVAGIGYYVRETGGQWGAPLQGAVIVLAVLALGLLASSGSARASLKVYINKHFFRYRYDYREEWLRFTQQLEAADSPLSVAQAVVQGLADMVESPGGAIWLRRAQQGDCAQFAQWNSPANATTLRLDSPLAAELSHKAWIIELDASRSGVGIESVRLPDGLLLESRYWLLVPLLLGSELRGFVILERPRTRIEVNWEVRDLLKTAARQGASHLSQLQATEALLEARKFDAFNKMSAFVVHDLKNIVTQLSLMMKNARRLKDNPEFQEDMLETVEHSLEKMRQLMLQLREGGKRHGVVHGVDLVQIAHALRETAARKGRVLELDIRDAISCRGHEERVHRVIGHAVQNAFDATPFEGQVRLTLKRGGSNACVTVQDTGCGMSREFIDTRFAKPFSTTKEQGMGIGVFESEQYLQELGGRIEVQSEVGVGTSLTLWFPLFFDESVAPTLAA